MYKIFISGSMRIKNIDSAVLHRINKIIASEYEILVGDALGVDSSIQTYLHSKGVKSVAVYCTDTQPRNNVGRWYTNKIKTENKPGTRAYFTAKDISMAKDCDYGLIIWDSKSTGTLSNVLELLALNKKSLVFVNKLKKFFEISTVEQFENLLLVMSKSALIKTEKKIGIKEKVHKIKHTQLDLFKTNQLLNSDG